VAFGIRELRDADVVSFDAKEERVGEKKVGVGNLAQEIVTNAKGEMEPVEALGCEIGQITRPHVAILEPRLVFHVAGKQAGDGARTVGGLFSCYGARREDGGRIGQMTYAVSDFEERVDEAASVVSGCDDFLVARDDAQTFRGRRARAAACGNDDKLALPSLGD